MKNFIKRSTPVRAPNFLPFSPLFASPSIQFPTRLYFSPPLRDEKEN